jgi:hypothetical protein
MHDPRIGRFFARDPSASKYPWNSPYAFSENNVIAYVELEGLEKARPKYNSCPHYAVPEIHEITFEDIKESIKNALIPDKSALLALKGISFMPNSNMKVDIKINKDFILEAIDEILTYSTIFDMGAAGASKFKQSNLAKTTVTESSAVVNEEPTSLNSTNTAKQSVKTSTKGVNNPNTKAAVELGNKVHYDKLNGGTGEQLPSALVEQYPETDFIFTKRGETGADVKVVGGTHPSEYPGSTWKPGNNFADFKPNTNSGKYKFNSEVKNGKLPENTERIPYNPTTGKLE